MALKEVSDSEKSPTMRCEMKTVRKITDELGVISDHDRLVISVQFDLIETQDFDEGVPVRSFSYGNLQFHRDPKPELVSRLLSLRSVNLTGAGVQTAIHLHSLNSFTVVSAIHEMGTDKRMSTDKTAAAA